MQTSTLLPPATNGDPDFDYNKKEARDFVLDHAKWLVRTAGIDGFRLDAVKHMPMIMIRDLRTAMDELYQECFGRCRRDADCRDCDLMASCACISDTESAIEQHSGMTSVEELDGWALQLSTPAVLPDGEAEEPAAEPEALAETTEAPKTEEPEAEPEVAPAAAVSPSAPVRGNMPNEGRDSADQQVLTSAKSCARFVRSFMRSIDAQLRVSFSVASTKGSRAPFQSKEELSMLSGKSQLG